MRNETRRKSDLWRESLTSRYLDLAETLPRFGRGFIGNLQSIRQHQRERAEKLYVETRAPSGADATYLGFRLLELFPAEECPKLVSGLRRLFPTTPYGRDQIDRFGTRVPDLFHGGWSNIGTLCREKPWLSTLQARIVPELPEEVQRVDISVHKVLPSAVVVALDVHLSDTATTELRRLHDRRYLPATRFHSWRPWRKHGWGRSESPAEWAMQDAIIEWQTQLHSGVESVVAPYLNGFFRRSEGGAGRLPCIDIFSVTGVPDGLEDTPKRLHGVWRWMKSLMLQQQTSQFQSYFRHDLLFSWAVRDDERPAVRYRLIQLYSEAPPKDPTKLQGIDALRETLDSVLPYICFLEAISRVAEQLETLRIRVYRALTRNSFLKPRLGPEMKLNDRVQMETMFVSRLSMELDDAKVWLRGELQLVRDLMRPPLRDEKPYSLADALEEALTFHLDHVRKHLDLVAKMFTDYIARRNVAVMYRLQRQVLFVAVVATVAAVIGLLVTWPQVRGLFQHLLE